MPWFSEEEVEIASGEDDHIDDLSLEGDAGA